MPNLSLTREYDRIFTIMRDEAIDQQLWDNVSARTALLYCYKEKGAIKIVGGHEHLSFKILKQLPTTSGYSDDDVLTPVRADPYTRAVYIWKQLQCPVMITGRDMIQTGEGAEPDLLASFIEAAEISMRDAIGGSAVGIYSDGDETVENEITGLQNILTSSETTGTVGQLSRATFTNWRHQVQNVSSAFDTNGLNRMSTLYREVTFADESPDIVVLTGATYDNFIREVTRTFEVQLPLGVVGPGNQGMIDAGFENIRFHNALMFPDDGVPADSGYFINSNYINLYVRQGRNAELTDFIKSREYDDLVAYVLWAGNQVCKGLRYNGFLQNGDTY